MHAVAEGVGPRSRPGRGAPTGRAAPAGRGAGTEAEHAQADAMVAAWVAAEGDGAVERGRATLREICRDDAPDLARMSVGLRVARSLLG